MNGNTTCTREELILKIKRGVEECSDIAVLDLMTKIIEGINNQRREPA